MKYLIHAANRGRCTPHVSLRSSTSAFGAQSSGFDGDNFSRSAIRAKSGSDAALILRITWPRWTFTVISLTPMVAGDLLVEAPGHDTGHHLTLPWGERLIAQAQRGERLFVLKPGAIAVQAKLNRVEKVLFTEWFRQKLYRARPSWPGPTSGCRHDRL